LEALARAVAGLLHRGGWLVGLVVLELLILVAFWGAGARPFDGAFDRRAAEADFLLLTLTSLPALVAGALLVSGDNEDGMTGFYRSCRVGPWAQAAGSALGLFAVTGVALTTAYLGSLALFVPSALGAPAAWGSLGLGLLSTLVYGCWGLALGAWFGSRWSAVAGGLAFWVATVFAVEAVVQAVAGALGPRWALPLVLGFTAADPSPLFRAASVAVRGQWWAYGPAFAAPGAWLMTPIGVTSLVLLGTAHVALPSALAAWGLGRRPR